MLHIYRIAAPACTPEWVDTINKSETCHAANNISDYYLYDSPVGEIYFCTDAHNGKVEAGWAVSGTGCNKVLVSLERQKPQPTEEVGVAFYNLSPRDAAKCTGKVFTYDALVSLGLEIGDKVLAPIGYINGPQFDTRVGTVVTLQPDGPPKGIRKRTITARA